MSKFFVIMVIFSSGMDPAISTDYVDSFVLHGKKWEAFSGIPTLIDKTKLEHFELSKVSLDTEILLKDLQQCRNLKTIKLMDMKWSGEFKRKIDLPHVTTYTVELPVSRPCVLNTAEEFMSLLFFIPSPGPADPPWQIDDSRFDLIDIECSIQDLDVAGYMVDMPRHPEVLLRIASGHELVAKNVRFDLLELLGYEDFIKISFTKSYLNTALFRKFKVSLLELTVNDVLNLHTQAELGIILDVAQYVKYMELSASIPKLVIDLKSFDSRSLKTLKIFTKNNSLQIDGNVIFHKLRDLELGSSRCCPTLLNTLLVAPRLKTLRLSNAHFSRLVDDFTAFQSLKFLETFIAGHMVLDVSSLPTTQLTRLEFEPDTRVVQRRVTEFPKIRTLKVDSSCDFDDSFVAPFSKTFRHLRSFIFVGTKSKISPKFFLQVLNTSATYCIVRYQRPSTLNNATEDQLKVAQLLTEFGVPEDYSYYSISLLRSNKYAKWTWVYSHTGTWSAILYVFYPSAIAFICVFGLIGNILNAIILFRKAIQSSTTRILLCLTFCDFVMIFASLNLIPHSLSNGFRYRHNVPPHGFPSDLLLRHLEVFFFYPLRKTAYTGSVYTTVLITYERFIAVAFPLHAKRLISKKRSTLYCCLIILASTLVNIPRWFESYSLYDPDKDKLHMSSVTLLTSREYRKYYHGWAWTIVIYIFPVLLILTFNITIYLKVKLASKARERIGMGGRAPNATSQVDMNLTRMLICLVLVFVILNLVSAAIAMYHTLFEFHIVALHWDKEKDMSEIEVVACLPILINSALNFIIYCAMGRKFREEFLKLMPKRIFALCPTMRPQNAISGRLRNTSLSTQIQ